MQVCKQHTKINRTKQNKAKTSRDFFFKCKINESWLCFLVLMLWGGQGRCGSLKRSEILPPSQIQWLPNFCVFLKTSGSTLAALKQKKEQRSQYTQLSKMLSKTELENSWHHWMPSPETAWMRIRWGAGGCVLEAERTRSEKYYWNPQF